MANDITLIHFASRQRSGVAIVIDADDVGWGLGWPTVEMPDGERLCLNPKLNTMRPATEDETAAFLAQSLKEVADAA